MIMRTHILLMILVPGFSAPTALASDEPPKAEEVTILPHWKKGEHHTYSWTKITRKTQGEKETARQEVESSMDLSVESADDKAIVLSWKQGARHFHDPEADANPVVRQYDALFEDQVMRLEIDPQEGSIRSVQNWQEIKDRTRQGMELLFKDREGADPKALAAAREQIENMLRTREQVESLCTKNAQIYFFPLGRQYTVKKTKIYESAYPSPFGGEPILSKGTITLTEYDPQTGHAKVQWGQTSDPAAVKKAVEAFLNDVSKKLGQVPPQLQGLTIEIQDKAEFELNAKTGWIDRLTYTHSTRTGDNLQEDTTTFLRQDEAEKKGQ